LAGPRRGLHGRSRRLGRDLAYDAPVPRNCGSDAARRSSIQGRCRPGPQGILRPGRTSAHRHDCLAACGSRTEDATWDYETLDRFVEAEASLVAKQLAAPRGKNPVGLPGEISASCGTTSVAADGEFDAIKAAVARLSCPRFAPSPA
jgi:hypothetical protein